MRILIWQQFASNHSSSFTADGKFKTLQEANTAAVTIRDILHRLEQWREQNDPTDDIWRTPKKLDQTGSH